MVLSQYIYQYPYRLIWRALKSMNQLAQTVSYCADPMDYVVLKPVLKHLPPMPVIAGNRRTIRYLREQGIRAKKLPCFPQAVIMSRHAAHKFPEQKIVKIGFRHGPYHFKNFANVRYYNAFDVYFFTSRRELELAKGMGITCGRIIGFPKLDPVFDGSYDEQFISQFRNGLQIDALKKTVIFTATWDGSGMSAIHQWNDRIESLTDYYNILVTVHPWTSQHYIRRLKGLKNIHFIDDPNVLPYLMIADVLVGDMSSIIAEFCTLNKPIITFAVPETRRTNIEITSLIRDISLRITHFDDIRAAIEKSIEQPMEKSEQRLKATALMFDTLDGGAGKRAAKIIEEIIHATH